MMPFSTVLDLDSKGAKDFFLQPSNYSNIPLPQYFSFEKIIKKSNLILTTKKGKIKGIVDIFEPKTKPHSFSDINHSLYINKDGKYAWRQLQILHPILYVDLVNHITNNWTFIVNRFNDFEVPRIKCTSIPVIPKNAATPQLVSQISNWINNTESRSIELALDFEYVFTTDIANCYDSIYTHSLPWALHDKDKVKNDYNNANFDIGNILDEKIRNMTHNQTNGIPQGSVLMDFIAEILLGYSDLLLSEKIQKDTSICINTEYQIIRYRDDYKIFTNSTFVGETILSHLSKVLQELGLRLNTSKTSFSNQIILTSLKQDKRDLHSSFLHKELEEVKKLCKSENNDSYINLKKILLLIYYFANNHINSSQTNILLKDYAEILNIDTESLNKQIHNNRNVLISILVDITYKNLSNFPACAIVLSIIFSSINEEEEIVEFIKKIHHKLSILPNTGFNEIWLQRISHHFDPTIHYSEKLCQIVAGNNVLLWNNDWINSKIRSDFESHISSIYEDQKFKRMSSIIKIHEIDIFKQGYQ